MKVGVCLPNYRKWFGPSEARTLVQAAEDWGFDSVWVQDHIVAPTVGPQEKLLMESAPNWMTDDPGRRQRAGASTAAEHFGDLFSDPWIVWAYVAACSTKLLLGSTIIVIPYRNPLVQAKMMATLDHFSNGRMILGTGSGHVHAESELLGLPYEERGAMTDEWLKVMVALWTQDPAEFHGRYFNFEGVRPLLRTVQKPHPPIWVGGHSKRSIRRAAELGQGWHPGGGVEPEDLPKGIDYLHEQAEKAGRGNVSFVISSRIGVHMSEIDQGGRGREGRARLTPPQAIGYMRSYERAGLHHAALNLPTFSLDVMLNQMEVFAKEVLPEIHS